MKVSIVTISFNQCQFLKQCMDSVLSQRDKLVAIGVELEYILVDPGSSDGSRELIESYGDEVIKIFEKDQGPADGLNKGFSAATGNIYGYINADDCYSSDAFVKAVQVFKNTNCDVFFGHGWIIDENDDKSHRCLSHKFSLKQYALGNCAVMQQSTFFKRNAYIKSGRFNIENRVSWDGELMVDMAIGGSKIIRVNEFLSFFRVYSTSISGSGDFLEAARIEHKRIISKMSINITSSKKVALLHRVCFRLLDPYYCALRAIDGLQYGKRIIPS